MRRPHIFSVVALAISVAVLVVAAGCIRRGSDDAAVQRPRLRWVVAAEPEGSDPARCLRRECLQHAALTLDGLFRADRKGNAVAALAERWSWSDPRTLVVVLKKNLRWSDGVPLTAATFVDRWRYLVRHCAEFPAVEPLLDLVEARAVCDGASGDRLGVVARDEQRLELRLVRPRPLFPLALAQPATWPVRDTIAGAPSLASGPFRLEHRDATGWRYGRNPSYHGSLNGTVPWAGGIELRVLPSPSLRLQSFNEAGADVVDDVPPDLVTAVPTARFETTGRLRALVFHASRRAPAALRRWLAGAVDRQEIVRLARWPLAPADRLLAYAPGAGVEATAPSPQLPGNATEWERLRADLSRSGTKLSLAADGPAELEIALALQAQWLRRLDLKVDIVGKGSSSPLMTLVRLEDDRLQPTKRFDAALSALAGDLIPSRRRALEALLAAVASAESPRELARALDEADAALVKDGLVIPLLVDTRPVLVATSWRELTVDGMGLWDAREARFGY